MSFARQKKESLDIVCQYIKLDCTRAVRTLICTRDIQFSEINSLQNNTIL